jgi:hypothetical protein
MNEYEWDFDPAESHHNGVSVTTKELEYYDSLNSDEDNEPEPDEAIWP